MDLSKRQRLEVSGWQVGTVENFLELSEAEAKMLEFRLSLSRMFKSWRESQELSQKALGELLNTNRSTDIV